MSGRTITDLASAARTLTQTASRTLALRDGHPPTVRVLREYRDDASAVVAAVLRDLAGGRSGAGIVVTPRAGELRFSELADAIERGSWRADG
jgi:hypothetical protein